MAEGINRTINLPQPSIFGRIGTGFGKGLAESLPKEIERARLQQGLQDLGNQKGLSRFQQFAGLAGLPGTNNAIIQGGADILNQEAYLDAVKNQYEGKGGDNGYVPTPDEIEKPRAGEIPSLATAQATEQSYQNFIPPTKEQERANAYKNFSQNKARYNNNFDNALKEQEDITQRNNERQKAFQEQEDTALKKEAQLKQALSTEASKLGIRPQAIKNGENVLPANFNSKMYQQYESKVLKSILPKKIENGVNVGGEGLTQQQAIDKYSKEMDEKYREYKQIETLTSASPLEFNRRVDALQPSFAANDNRDVLMDRLVATQGLSPVYAAHKAYPIEGRSPELNRIRKANAGQIGKLNDGNYSELLKEMGDKNSPLSFTYELDQKGIDPTGWLEYLNQNRDKLKVWQAEQLSPYTGIGLKDMWLSAWEK
jgi:hypothetical protein